MHPVSYSGLIAGFFAIAVALTGIAPASAEQKVPASRAEISLSFAPIVKRTAPAVVNVYARKLSRTPGALPFGDDPFFKKFFGNDGFLGGTRRRLQNSLGSGVIVEKSGFIVTNFHVIKNANDVRVALADKREFQAKVLLRDERTDLAILKIDSGGEPLPFLQLADSDRLQVGDLVLAIGNPFGVGQTVTSGIVSALARTHVGVSSYQFFIQTDAAINPGNSGGALIDMNGQVIGINTAIYSRSGGSNGIGFAIPINMVKAVIRSARAGNKVVRAWSGAVLQEVTADIAQNLGFKRPRGALVAGLHKASPLVKAGIKRGDVILALNGKPINNANEFSYRFATANVGETAQVNYIRGGRERTATVKLISPPEDVPRNTRLISGSNPFSGAVVANMSPAVAEELGLAIAGRGVAVLAVKGGPARRLGFRKGDIILTLNGRKIKSVKLLAAELSRSDGFWRISIDRKGKVIRLRLGG